MEPLGRESIFKAVKVTKAIGVVLAMMLAAATLVWAGTRFLGSGWEVWIQDGVLLFTAMVVIWYTVETGRLRVETRRMVEESERSRLQADASSVVDAEIRLHDRPARTRLSELEDLHTNWMTRIRDAICDLPPYDPPFPGLRVLLKYKESGFTNETDRSRDYEFSIENILTAVLNPSDRSLFPSAALQAIAHEKLASACTSDVEWALEDYEFLIRLINGPSMSASQVARRHLKSHERVKEVFLGYIALQKFLTRDADYGETYLDYLEKTGDEPQDLIRRIRRALKPEASGLAAARHGGN